VNAPSRSLPHLKQVPFGPGQSIVCYTDGVTDMGTNETPSNPFNSERLQAAHDQFTGASARELCDHVLYEALVHGRLLAASTDDMTVLALHWQSEPGTWSLPATE
jgi:serine phosphatase RsbU (regulator of sigma subunit)